MNWTTKGRRARLARTAVVLFLALESYGVFSRPQPCRPMPIFRGVTYACEELDGREEGPRSTALADRAAGARRAIGAEGSGLAHIVEIDLSAPGIGLYLTPLDPAAVARGFQYRLDKASSVLGPKGWPWWSTPRSSLRSRAFCPGPAIGPGDSETIVADGRPSPVDAESFLLWFEVNLTPHVESRRPPEAAVVRRARWAVGGYSYSLRGGRVLESARRQALDRRTAVGIDTARRRLWLAVFERASDYAALRVLARHGAKEGMMLDGGHSTTMVLGPKAAGGKGGTLLGGWWPTATFLGVRADGVRR